MRVCFRKWEFVNESLFSSFCGSLFSEIRVGVRQYAPRRRLSTTVALEHWSQTMRSGGQNGKC